MEQLCTVLINEDLTPTVFRIRFALPEAVEFFPGQALRIHVPDPSKGDQFLTRYYSIASVPGSKEIEICVRQAGVMTAYLKSLKPGQQIALHLPLGEFVLKPSRRRHVVFIANGTGIAPLRSMALSKQHQEARPQSSTFIFGARDEKEVLYAADLDRPGQIHWVVALSRPSPDWKGFRGRVTDYLVAKAAEIPWKESEFYICGSSEMVLAVRAFLLAKGVGETSIHHEPYLLPKKKD